MTQVEEVKANSLNSETLPKLKKEKPKVNHFRKPKLKKQITEVIPEQENEPINQPRQYSPDIPDPKKTKS